MSDAMIYKLAHALKDLEPPPRDDDPALKDWHEWRSLCESAACWVSRGDAGTHMDFMDACGL